MDHSDEFLEKVRRQNENAFFPPPPRQKGEPLHPRVEQFLNVILEIREGQQAEEETSISLGAIEQIYDTCGMMGLCPECRRQGITNLHEGCGKHYVVGQVRGEPEP